jgi:hypothetical protein
VYRRGAFAAVCPKLAGIREPSFASALDEDRDWDTNRQMPLSHLSPVLGAVPAASLQNVMALMSSIDDTLVPKDGVSWFNKLYRRVTERVMTAVADGTFENPDFVTRLDVVFANLYFDALQKFLHDRDAAPRAWSPLFDGNDNPGVAPIQFALAGMNAHINRDLMVALVRVCEEMGLTVEDDSPHNRDYDRLNPILEEVEKTVRAWFLEGLVGEFDHLFEKIDTIVANWSVVEARSAAWSHAETLWRIRNIDFIEEAYIEGLDGLVGFAGRGLMVRAGSLVT